MNPKATFTPGPWDVSGNDVIIADSSDGGIPVALTYTLSQEEGDTFSNAALIAAAPDMFQALATIYDALDFTGHYAEARLCAAVLNKARGKS